MSEIPESSSGSFSFVAMELDILAFWEQRGIFQKSLDQTSGKKPYIFYDGPPFATGLPHHGHLVASTIKDVIPRYFTMKGRHVLRRFGWDCHGLPIEQEINNQLKMSAQEAVETLGVAGYNNECRNIVQRYVSQWRHTIRRIGRWVDFDNDYKTMDAWYMESVWWVVKQLWQKELIYQGEKVVPISTALGTVLSNFEATSNYKDVQDPAITVLFKLADEDAYLAAWTTTPWTLPSNLALCVGADIDYVKVHDAERNMDLYLAEARLGVYQQKHSLAVIECVKGRALTGRRYAPLFPYFADQTDRGAFTVVSDDYVTTDSGTGLVHQAPAFGEEDYRVLRSAGIEAFACPVTLHGHFTDEVSDFSGEYVKDADPGIIRYLKDQGVLYQHEVIQHAYPYCYRSDTPLIYRAIPSWYVRVTQLVGDLAANNEQVHWVPEHIKQGRFGNWIKGAIDWAISRNRVWGTPLPIWQNEVTGKTICMGSIDELESFCGVRIDDLHREFVDPLSFEVAGEEGTYRRVEEVLDCWFESGSMPYAQLHYPFENQKVFEQGYPAEFIAEGLDQTRGWFYTLMVLATALYDKPAFRNVIVNGMVMAQDGKKMSKRLRNYTPPDQLMERYGADALRLYLINSGLVRGEEQRFADSGVKDMVRRALLPWYNAFQFLKTYAAIDGWSPEKGQHQGSNILDQWILSKLQSLKQKIAREMNQYHLYNVVPELFHYIEDLTNWYIRLNRARFWGEDISADKIAAYSTLYVVVSDLSIAMAPFAPFLSEYIFQQLATLSDRPAVPESVHLCPYPEPEEILVKPRLEDAVSRMQQVILLGRRKREEMKISLRTPLSRLTIIHSDQTLLDEISTLEDTIRSELNVKSVHYDQDEEHYIKLYAKPNFPLLGRRLGKRMKEFQALIQNLDRHGIDRLQQQGMVEIGGEQFSSEEIEVFREAREGTATVSNRFISIELDCRLSEELISEGRAREMVNRIQRSRKDLGLNVADRIHIRLRADQALLKVLQVHQDYIMAETLCTRLDHGPLENGNLTLDSEDMRAQVAGLQMSYSLKVQP